MRVAEVIVSAVIGGVLASGCGSDPGPDNGALLTAAAAHQRTEVTVSGPVIDILPDLPPGRDGAHQRFHVDVSGVAVEIDHNLSLAGRVPLSVGDMVTVHGQFEPDRRGPVIHETHHATGRHEGGWIQLRGQRYD